MNVCYDHSVISSVHQIFPIFICEVIHYFIHWKSFLRVGGGAVSPAAPRPPKFRVSVRDLGAGASARTLHLGKRIGDERGRGRDGAGAGCEGYWFT